MKKVVKKVVSPLVAAAMTLSIGFSATACGSDHEHHFADSYSYNENTHWHPCNVKEGCGAKYGETAHDFVDGICSVCEYEEGTTPNPPPVEIDPNPPVIEPEDPTVQYTVTFETNGGTPVESQTVNKGATLSSVTSTNGNKYLVGWYTDSACTKPWNFRSSVMGDMTLYAKWEEVNAAIVDIKSYNESLAVTFKEGNPDKAKVEYRLANGSVWTQVDKELVRADGANSRVDIVGLAEGSYKVKITLSSGGTVETPEIAVAAYDRSGYAHFNYSEGVGAYKDDGTLKDNAIVIYVTEENKNTVMAEACAKYDALTMYQVPGYSDKNADSIGWWLNNSQYTMDNKNSSSNKRPSNTYDASNGKNLGFKKANESHPIVIRFIGTVTTPEGCTKYNSEDEGGSVGDNGNMARMKNYKNITLEGIGEDAQIKGWGFHFIAGTDAANGQGKSFEVRNLTFNEYTEDAIGMEGQQSGSTITGPVERCWIHHNTFLPGRCANPAESDKAEGDGSCDFKRGQYFTCSYNYYEYCHKTNLVGSSDSSLQYNMTYHHNMWYQCSSRIPLTRQANVHFYNNYVWGDATEKTTPYSHISKFSLSYVHSLRANCYIFTEANYYEGSKNIAQTKGTGAAKGWNNMYYANVGDNTITEATTRDQKVSNSCKYGSVDYTAFDTNPDLFYYDAQNKQSDCLLDSPVDARLRVLREVGVNGFTTRVSESMIKDADKPAAPLNVPESGLTIDVTKATLGGTVDGVKFINAKNSSGVAKGKGILATFTVTQSVEISLSTAGSGDTGCELVKSDGTVIAGGISSYKGTLKPGTYFISSSQKDKEGKITDLSFKISNSDEDRIKDVEDLIEAIGEVDNSTACGSKISMAQTAYNALPANLQAKVTNAAKLTAAAEKYNKLCVDPVIAVINAIGTVNEDSGTKIANARSAYNKLTAAQKQLVTNYGTLTAAESAYENYEVAGVNKAIANLAEVSTATTEAQIRSLLEQYETVNEMYSVLDPTQKSQITGYSKVTSGIAALESKLAPFSVRDMIAALPAKADITIANAADVKAAREAYDALTADQKTAVGSITRLTDAEEVISEIAKQGKVAIFTKSNASLATSAGFTVNGTAGYKGTSQTFEYNGTQYNSPLKMQSSNTITFSTSAVMNVTIKVHSGGSQKILLDGKSYTANSDGIIEITSVATGSHTIGRDGEAWLCYVVLTPAV